jgi:penicillin V acylase-like amidase (Ntn superfamily)
MNYYGPFEERLGLLQDWINEHADTVYNSKSNIVADECSMFAVSNDTSSFLGRNFDWEPFCGILITKTAPPGKYGSFFFSRMEDLGFNRHINPKELTGQQKSYLLFFPFYATDGINEKGLAIGLTGVNSQRLTKLPERETIFITMFIRHALDNCKNVDEVMELSKRYNLFDGTLSTISHHFLAADAEGNSLIIEYKNGEMQYIKKSGGSQVITNSYVYNKTLEGRKKCWRYEAIYDAVNEQDAFTNMECMDILKSAESNTRWSAVYDLVNRKVIVAINGKYKNLYEFGF